MANLLCATWGAGEIVMVVVIVLMMVALIVIPMITNKKRQKQIEELHNSITAGDTIKTVGGIVGTIVEIRQVNALEKEIVLETGLEGRKSTMVFDINAIYQVMAKGANAKLSAAAANESKEEQPAETEEKAE